MKKRRISAIFIFCAFLFSGTLTKAVSVFYIDSKTQHAIDEARIDLACRFYGLSTNKFYIDSTQEADQFLKSMAHKQPAIFVFHASALVYFDPKFIIEFTHKQRQIHNSLLISGITPDISEKVIQNWSDNKLTKCSETAPILTAGYYKIKSDKNIALELAGQKIPYDLHNLPAPYNLHSTPSVNSVIDIYDSSDHFVCSSFCRINIEGIDFFFLANLNIQNRSEPWQFQRSRFMELTPILMFLRFAAGDECWHADHDLANLVIDDPWLREPYGNLSYVELLKEMQRHHFHTTIAFIPWNYDRSEREAADIVRINPNYYSICLHGNNHDQREFEKYKILDQRQPTNDDLKHHEFNIQQAIARMEAFQELTDIKYDRVMVFPHRIAPEPVLELLKKYNVVATANSKNIPSGRSASDEPLHLLRSTNNEYANFLSLKRMKAFDSIYLQYKADIAIDLFLDNPLIFYTHQEYFQAGISSFNKTADWVNSLQPRTQWTGLENICRHAYLRKYRQHGIYDILSFSNYITLKNDSSFAITYYVRKAESFKSPIKHVNVNGNNHHYTTSDNFIDLIIDDVAAGDSCMINIEYANNFDSSSIDISKKGFYTAFIRKLSDFRDITLSTHPIFLNLIKVFYKSKMYKLGMPVVIFIFVSGTVVIISIVFITIKHWKHKKAYN